MGNRRSKMRDIEFVTVEYEGESYDVCVAMAVEDIESVYVTEADTDITPVMRKSVMDWMLEKAVEEIEVMRSEPMFMDMGRCEREIEGY